MTVDPADAQELSNIAREISAGILQGDLRYPSDTGGWQLGELDLSEYLDRYRNQRPVLLIAPIGQCGPETYTCGIGGFVMREVGESHGEAAHCSRRKLAIQEEAVGFDSGDAAANLIDQEDKPR
jgi:hypothetical protein